MKWLHGIKYLLCYSLSFGALTGCGLFYNVVAQFYQNQPTIIPNHYPAAKYASYDIKDRGNLDLSSFKPASARIGERSNIGIAFASSGGGYRASNLMLGAMMQLSNTPSVRHQANLLKDIDYFSTVSGSGLAVGYYLSHYLNAIKNNRAYNLNRQIEYMIHHERYSQKPNILRRNLDPLLFTGKLSDARKFEQAINQLYTVSGTTLKLGDVFINKNSNQVPLLPYWIVNTTIFQNMIALPFTPKKLAEYKVNGYPIAGKQYLKPKFTNNSKFYSKIPFAVAQSASASYPVALAPVTLTSNACKEPCFLHLIDGGVSDNLGIISSLKVLGQDRRKIKILFILDASSAKDSPFSVNKTPPNFFNVLERTPDMVTDGQSEQIKATMQHLVHSLLCNADTKNVIGIYLALDDYDSALNLNTSFSSSLNEQKKLIRIGKRMIKNNKKLKQLLAQIKAGRVTMGLCEPKKPTLLPSDI